MLTGLCLLMISQPGRADLRTPSPPGWWDPDGLGGAGVMVGQDWHYRVPVTLPATSTVNSTAKVDVNFATLMTQLSISGTFDINSVRVVRPNGQLATIQEYTDTLFANATDAAANNRGEVKWIVEDGGAQTYYIYFDITQNGTKPANPQAKINGNFEHSSTGQEDPTGWTGNKTDATYDAQVRPNETVSVADATTVSTNGSPNTGSFSYLAGARTNADNNNGEIVTLTRTITVPASNPGNLTVRWKPQGWDSAANGSTQWDFIRIDIVGSTTTELVGPTAGNYATRPFAPNYGTNGVSTTSSGYGQFNYWDMTTGGTHQQGMTVTRGAQPWWSYNQSLAAYAGQTITLRFRVNHSSSYRTWFLIDDIEWSLVTGTLGTAEAFGAQITIPTVSSGYEIGQKVVIAAQLDARPNATTTAVTANIINNAGTTVATGVRLYNDGTHGDAVANDSIWTNNGSDPANPTYTIPSGATGTNWIVRVFARDGSTSTVAAANNGLAKRNGLPNPAIEANYWNIDEVTFSIVVIDLSVTKTSIVLSDPANGTTNPKRIPGAVVRYCILVTNSGTATATNIALSDPLPGDVTYNAGTLQSGTSCGGTGTSEDDNATGADESDPHGGSFTPDIISASTTSLAPAASFSLVYLVTVD